MFKNIKSIYILDVIFKKFLRGKIYLRIIKHNKKLQKRLNISLDDYKTFKKIEIVLIPISELDDLQKQARFLNKQLARLKSGFNSNPSETELQKVYVYEIFIEHIKNDMQNILNRLENEIINFKQNKFNFSKANSVYQKMKNIEKKLKESISEF